MITSKMKQGLREYWRGYRRADRDAEMCGIESAKSEYSYGLNGCGRAFARGYHDRISGRRRGNKS